MTDLAPIGGSGWSGTASPGGSPPEPEPARARRRRWAVPRSLLVGTAPMVIFAVVSIIRARPSDKYQSVGTTLPSVIHQLLIPELITAGGIAVIVTGLGWWPIVWRDARRGRPTWTVLAPALLVAVAVARLPLVDWHARSARYYLLLALGTLLVGVFEETMARGVLLAGLRRRLPEVWVWAISCAAFGLLHFVNALAGQPLGTTVVQVMFAAAFGSGLYLARRLSRSLLAPILIHGFWDFGGIALLAGPDPIRPNNVVLLGLLGLASFAILILCIVAGAILAVRDDRDRRRVQRWRPVPPLGDFAAVFAAPGVGAPGVGAPGVVTSGVVASGVVASGVGAPGVGAPGFVPPAAWDSVPAMRH
ncbi:CPBP family intramembrane glutamic endopeptidase [Curtobacterium ammoniigenes]|uniref:CPBP family intramembrane glutamic endopeptidase n=1 Tax=Curtobacterium ammoniigenes TaxID=395387 RepID=UPI00082CF537|nr:CPBP family intramembrane glutamic endopeptidase [Curtobacterium ammoniigenes]